MTKEDQDKLAAEIEATQAAYDAGNIIFAEIHKAARSHLTAQRAGESDLRGDAAEIWALAQYAPHEGFKDAIDRIEVFLNTHYAQRAVTGDREKFLEILNHTLPLPAHIQEAVHTQWPNMSMSPYERVAYSLRMGWSIDSNQLREDVKHIVLTALQTPAVPQGVLVEVVAGLEAGLSCAKYALNEKLKYVSPRDITIQEKALASLQPFVREGV